ncbi:hypothetical protein BZM27_50005 [Paraburkholderia steynii]|uniref:Uncharacterized protein n=1 Tax=Paraburkholderia steynii TaxID=1245441 RepID=A0A4R0X707_9BURK|nr:hypothetical protein BZM27_50005 [Paraburkholderia steynii]
MRLYQQAIRSARANGFLHVEALANELAARFYAAHDFDVIAETYLQNARYCYLRWRADGKVRQLEQLYPHLGTEELKPGLTGNDRSASRIPRSRNREQGIAGGLR